MEVPFFSVPVTNLPGVGPSRAKALEKLNIRTVEDLLYHVPRRYIDYGSTKPIKDLIDGEEVTVLGKVTKVQTTNSASDPRLWVTRAELVDGTGIMTLVWFARTASPRIRPYVSAPNPGTWVLVSGKVSRRYGAIQMRSPEWEPGENRDSLHVGRIVPLYPACEGLGQKTLRVLVKRALDGYLEKIPEFLADEDRRRLGLLGRREALENVHFPKDSSLCEAARFRLGFDEVFLLQVALGVTKETIASRYRAIPHAPDGKVVETFLGKLPFALTGAQRRAIEEIGRDMERERPMNRLLQGDVGSGKTVVAAFALAKTVENGCQGALMAPTEILARQHHATLLRLFDGTGIRVGLLLGGERRSLREETVGRLASGEIDVLVGTHALLEEDVTFLRLGLVITDEQHRFGVGQRLLLKEKGTSPHVLVMSATPIPRTLALTLYADLDVSVLDELPHGRLPIETYLVPRGSEGRVWKFVRGEVAKGRQAYIICPLIEESDALELQAATAEFARLKTQVFPDLRLGLLHGRMNAQEKASVMSDFVAGKTDILVSTTVVEVGVDVPNATVMVVENAERFGLAQLHQLRGRVGRGEHKSYCILLTAGASSESRRRLSILTRTADGFAIAEEDLKLRGPGEFLGLRQHGMGDLGVRLGLINVKALSLAREEAARIQREDPGLRAPEHLTLALEIKRRFGGRLELANVG